MKILSQTPWLTVKHVNQGLHKINYLKTAIRVNVILLKRDSLTLCLKQTLDQ